MDVINPNQLVVDKVYTTIRNAAKFSNFVFRKCISSFAFNEWHQHRCGVHFTLLPLTLNLPRESMEHGKTAVWPETTVTLTIGTSNDGSIPETGQ